MVRITYQNKDGTWGANGINIRYIQKPLRSAITKLKAYEDTGISPEEVKRLIKENKELKAGLNDAAV